MNKSYISHKITPWNFTDVFTLWLCVFLLYSPIAAADENKAEDKNNKTINVGIDPALSSAEAIYHMREEGIVANAQAEDWSAGTAFRVIPMSPEEANKVAGCIAELQPDYSDALKNAGFSLPAPTWTSAGNDS